MFARIAKFEGLNSGQIDETIAETRQQIREGFKSPPEGLEEIKEVMMLIDREAGKGVDISLFDTEDGMRRGHDALDAMSPPEGSGVKRVGVGFYEVALRETRS